MLGLSDGAPFASADVTLRDSRGIGYANLWLSEPTLVALDVELERIEREKNKRQARIAKRVNGRA